MARPLKSSEIAAAIKLRSALVAISDAAADSETNPFDAASVDQDFLDTHGPLLVAKPEELLRIVTAIDDALASGNTGAILKILHFGAGLLTKGFGGMFGL